MNLPLQGYFSMLLTASVLGALCAAFAGSAFERYLRYLASLICILLVLAPFRSFDATALFQTDVETPAVSLPDGLSLQERAGAQAENEICAWISQSRSAQTGITPAEVRIDIDWTADEPVIRAVAVQIQKYLAAARADSKPAQVLVLGQRVLELP